MRAPEGMSLREITEFLFCEDPPEPADLIFVFGGEAEGRARHAARLYREGFAPRILFTGGAAAPGGRAEADHLAAQALAMGVPEEAILRESRSANTVENVVLGRDALARAGLLDSLRAAILVSAPYHMLRAKLTFQRHFGHGVRVICCPHGETGATRDRWWHDEQSRRRVFRELEKVHTYRLKGDL